MFGAPDCGDDCNGPHDRYFVQISPFGIVTDKGALYWGITPHCMPIVTNNGGGVRKNRSRLNFANLAPAVSVSVFQIFSACASAGMLLGMNTQSLDGLMRAKVKRS